MPVHADGCGETRRLPHVVQHQEAPVVRPHAQLAENVQRSDVAAGGRELQVPDHRVAGGGGAVEQLLRPVEVQRANSAPRVATQQMQSELVPAEGRDDAATLRGVAEAVQHGPATHRPHLDRVPQSVLDGGGEEAEERMVGQSHDVFVEVVLRDDLLAGIPQQQSGVAVGHDVPGEGPLDARSHRRPREALELVRGIGVDLWLLPRLAHPVEVLVASRGGVHGAMWEVGEVVVVGLVSAAAAAEEWPRDGEILQRQLSVIVKAKCVAKEVRISG